jgi:type VI secretion system VasD/TssJ family lipoprotein
MRSIPTVLLLLLGLLCAGCSGNRTLSLPIKGVAPLNPNEAQESTPVSVRLFLLASPDRFRAATVERLWTDARNALGDDLLAPVCEVTVFPGGDREPAAVHSLESPGSARFLGVLALFQRSESKDQRAIVVPLAEAERQGIRLSGFAAMLDGPSVVLGMHP